MVGLHNPTQSPFLCDENIHNALPAILNDMTSIIVWLPLHLIEENVFALTAVTLYLLPDPSLLSLLPHPLLITSPPPTLTQM